ncbi:MAG TPA: hypothetical protein PLA50_14850, partial [Bacteroidia bacterium]|nr:hypothetical protein [Bacteroidia bacterium]
METAQCLRLCIPKNQNSDLRALASQVPDPDTWQDHYQAKLADDSRPMTWRVALADKICNQNAVLPPEIAHACAATLAEGYLADAPMNAWQALRIHRAFNLQPKTPEWEALARRLAEGWTFKNRNNQKPETSGLIYRPFSESVLEALETHLLLGDAELTRKFLVEKNAFDRIQSDARAVATLVAHGEFDQAGRILKQGCEFQDITDDYIVGTFDYRVHYSQRLHERLAEFLATLDDPAL